jgi:hypothetical protein
MDDDVDQITHGHMRFLEQSGELMKCGHPILQEVESLRNTCSMVAQANIPARLLCEVHSTITRVRCYRRQTESFRND